jgi:hypothetical protein
MWDRLWEVHRDVDLTGRAGMEKHSKKFYDKMTRPIIELYLKFSSEYQVKLQRLINHG